MRASARLLLLALLLAAAGCAARPFVDYQEGPHRVAAARTVVHDPAQNRDLSLHVTAPAEAGSYPVVVFSHGAFCYPQNYATVIDHWASHGYIVIAPDHLDSPNNRERMRPEQAARLLESRIRDLSFVADSVTQIVASASITAAPDPSRMAIAGHSFGGMLAQIKIGLRLLDPQSGAAVSEADPRFRAALIMSGVGQMPQMAADAFDGIDRPLIANGGTLDVGNVGTGQIFPWEWRMSPYTLAPPGDKYAVTVDGADHYFGGLICRADRGGEDDPQGAAIVRALQTAFLDAYLKDKKSAQRFLRTADIEQLTEGRARLQRK